MNLKFCIYFTILIAISGCSAKFQDISLNPQYSIAVGNQYVTNSDLLIFGWTHNGNKSKPEGYEIHDYPGIGGHTVVSRETLPRGTKFTVLRVLKCKNCFPFPAYVQFEVKLPPENIYGGVKVTMSDQLFYSNNAVTRLDNGL